MTNEEAAAELEVVKLCEVDTLKQIKALDLAIRALTQSQADKPLTLEELRGMDGQPVWVKQYKTVGIVCLSARCPKEPAVLFWWRQETHMLYVSTCNLEVYPYHSDCIDRRNFEPCERCKPADFPPDRCAHSFHVVDSEIYYYDTEEGWEGEEIKFCPWCGRPLTPEEGVES